MMGFLSGQGVNILLCKVLKVPTLFKYHGDIVKTDDKSSSCYRFQSKKIYTRVVKTSK